MLSFGLKFYLPCQLGICKEKNHLKVASTTTTRILEAGGYWNWFGSTMPSMAKGPFMLCSACGFLGLVFVALWSQDSCPILAITFSFKAGKRGRGSASEISSYTCPFCKEKKTFLNASSRHYTLLARTGLCGHPVLPGGRPGKASSSLLHL